MLVLRTANLSSVELAEIIGLEALKPASFNLAISFSIATSSILSLVKLKSLLQACIWAIIISSLS
jgi:hypothetical protein